MTKWELRRSDHEWSYWARIPGLNVDKVVISYAGANPRSPPFYAWRVNIYYRWMGWNAVMFGTEEEQPPMSFYRVPHRCAIMIRREFERRWRVATAKVLLGVTPFDHLVIHKIVNYGA